MRTKIFYFAAIIALASCAKNELTENAVAPMNSDVIGFNTSTGSTRAADNATQDELQSGFNVIGFDKSGNVLFTNPADNGGTSSSKYLWSTDKWKWDKETNDKKWPTASADYPLTFIAAFPLIADDTMGPWVSGGASYTKAIEIDAADFTANHDLLAAKVEVKEKPTSGTTILNFKHILSKIAFQIISPTDYKIYIQSLTINNVAKNGHTYNYKDGAYDAENTAYTDVADYNHLAVISGSPSALTGGGDDNTKGVVIDNTTTGETWKLMPQGLTTAWDKAGFTSAASNYSGSSANDWTTFLLSNSTILDGAMLELVYRMEDADGKSIVGWKASESKPSGGTAAAACYVKVAYVLDLSKQENKSPATAKGWLPGYSYTYQIKLGTPDASNGTVIDPNYKDENGGDTDIPIDNPATKPGDDITKTDGYIGFEVKVDEWIDNPTEIK